MYVRVFVVYLAIFSLAMSAVIAVPLLQGDRSYLAAFTDDAFYYIETAKHIVQEGYSTFDGITHTNGYHPLWMIVNVVIMFITDCNETLFVSGMVAIYLLCSYFFITRVQKLADILWGDSLLKYGVIVVAGTIALKIMAVYMEATILIPLIAQLYLFYENQRQKGEEALFEKNFILKFGFLSSFVILARIDAGLLILFLLIMWLTFSKYQTGKLIRSVMWFGIGGVLVPLYFFYNKVVFGSLQPVSGQAKQIKSSVFSDTPIMSIVKMFDGFTAFMLLIPAVIVLIVYTQQKKKFSTIVFPMLLFPPLYYVILGFISEWDLFIWYRYPMPFMLMAGVMIIWYYLRDRFVLFRKSMLEGTVSLALIVGIGTVSYKAIVLQFERLHEKTSVYAHGLRIKEFADTHPGIYAMGDRAGLTGYMVDSPIIHLEGLAADHTLLTFIRRQAPLAEVFAHYHISYVIVSVREPLKRTEKGYLITIPDESQSGSRSFSMKHFFPNEPIMYFVNSDRNFNFNQIGKIVTTPLYTYIFKV